MTHTQKRNRGIILTVFVGALASGLMANDGQQVTLIPAKTLTTPNNKTVTVRVVTPTQPVQAQSQVGTVAAASGQRVHIDPATKRVRPPTPEEEKEFTASTPNLFSRDTSKLVPVFHSNGMISVDLQGGFMSAAVARISADGKVSYTCVSDAKSAEAAMTGAAKKEVASEK